MLGNIQNARTREQIDHLQRTVGMGKCPFCPDNGFDPEVNKVIIAGEYWQGWQNPFPYPHNQHHFVFATLEHIENVADLTPAMWEEWGRLNQELIERFSIPGGGITMRFGLNQYNAGTLSHCHSHIQVPDLTGPSFQVFAKSPLPLMDQLAPCKGANHLELLARAFLAT